MTEQRKALHDQVDETREEDIDRLADLMHSFLHPSESPESEELIFDPRPAEFEGRKEFAEPWPDPMADFKAKLAETVVNSLGDAWPRLGIDREKIAAAFCGCSRSGGKTTRCHCNWLEGRVFHRLSMFYLKEQRVVTLERCYLLEQPSELIYKVRVLTPNADTEKELTVVL